MNSINFIKNYLLSLLLVFNLSFAKQTGAPDFSKTNNEMSTLNSTPPYKKYFYHNHNVLPEGNIWWKIEDKVINIKKVKTKIGTMIS